MCDRCKQRGDTVSVVIRGVYRRDICRSCVAELQAGSSYSSGAQSFDRRRQYEDYAQDTVQPYDAGGNPRPEFYRLYPRQAEKIFTPAEIARVKRVI